MYYTASDLGSKWRVDTVDCNNFFRIDLAVQIFMSPISVDMDVGTGANSCAKI